MANGTSWFRQIATALVPGASSFFAPPTVSEPSKSDLRNAIALVDPSRLLKGWSIFPYNPGWLVSRKGLSIIDQMKRDEQVKSALKFKKDSVLASGWEVVSPGDQKDDWEVTRFVRDAMAFVPNGWNHVLTNVLSGLEYGYSVAEKIMVEQDKGEWKGKLMFSRIQDIKPHYINFSVDEFGVLQSLIQFHMVNSNTLLMPPGKFIIYTHGLQFGNYYGTSDLEACYRSWWTKDNSYKWLAVTLERFGMAPLFALYDPNVYAGSMVTELQKVVKGIQNASLGVIPRTTKESLEFWSQDLNKGSSDLFLKALERFDQHIARALLVPDLTGMSSSAEQSGSRARSQTHAESFIKVVLQLQNDIAAQVMNGQVIPQLCDLNFPSLASYPVFKFQPFTEDRLTEIIAGWTGLVAGQVVNKIEDDETHLRKIMGFPDNENPKVLPNPAPAGGMPGEPGASPFGGKPKPAPTSVQTTPATGKPGETPLKKETKVVASEELSTEMKEFALDNDAVWVEMEDGQRVAVPAEEMTA